MRINCKRDYKTDYAYLDKNLKMKIYECYNLAQNTGTEYFVNFHGDNITIRQTDGAMWVIAKSKIHFFKSLDWLNILHSESYITSIKPIRIETETKFTDENGEPVFAITQQSCPLDIKTRRIRKLDTITFPKDLEPEKSIFKGGYQRFTDEFTESDFIYEQRVFSQDIDFSNHVNNAVYIRFVFNALSNEFLDKINITDMEIHYIAESKEGQVLRVYKKIFENGTIRFLIKEQDREIIRASIKYN